MKLSDLNNLKFETVGSWPLPIRIGAILAACLALALAIYVLVLSDLNAQVSAARDEETALRQSFESKQVKAANLPALKVQLVEIKDSFGDLLKRLPNKTEVAALLVDISQQGLGAGLEFRLFKPGAESQTDFYVELPIQIAVTGTYHEFGRFISGLSELPRIVTTHNIRIKPEPTTGSSEAPKLGLELTGKTYRYMDPSEIEDKEREKKP